jgi:hypothetical protein
MENVIKVCKPERLMVKRVCADFYESRDCCVYVGGGYYNNLAQIHLSEQEVHALAKYFSKASEYLKGKSK